MVRRAASLAALSSLVYVASASVLPVHARAGARATLNLRSASSQAPPSALYLRGGAGSGEAEEANSQVLDANGQLEKQVSDLAASYDKLAKSYGLKGKSFAPTRTVLSTQAPPADAPHSHQLPPLYTAPTLGPQALPPVFYTSMPQPPESTRNPPPQPPAPQPPESTRDPPAPLPPDDGESGRMRASLAPVPLGEGGASRSGPAVLPNTIERPFFAPTRSASYSNLNEVDLTEAPLLAEGEEPAPPPQELVEAANIKMAEKILKDAKIGSEMVTSQLVPPDERLKIIIVASEVAPFSKSGGLADVSDKLGVALSRMGHKVMTVAPLYWRYDGVQSTGKWKEFNIMKCKYRVEYFHKWHETVPASNGMPAQGVDHVFVQQGCYERWGMYGHNDDLMRFALLSWASLEAPFAVNCDGDTNGRDGQPYGDDVVFLVNDWMVGLVPLIMTSHYRRYGCYDKARTVFDIHNMGYCGNFAVPDPHDLGLPNGDYFDKLFHDRQIKLLKGGIEMADRVVTVSPSYKDEITTPEGGFGLHDACKGRMAHLDGILNGVDTEEWNPETDHFLSKKFQGYDNFFSAADPTGKKGCKLHLQASMGLQEHGDCPVIAFIGRLAHQKGIDLLCSVLDWLMTENSGVTGWVQVICMGTGADNYANLLRNTAGRYHGKIVAHIGFTPELEHKIIAGADILVMPSRYEPCGLPQMYAQRYGTIPVVHATGGLKDSVEQYDPFNNAGTGWKFDRCDAEGLKFGLWHALDTYKHHKEAWRSLVRRAMEKDFSWASSAKRYCEIFKWARIDPPFHRPHRSAQSRPRLPQQHHVMV